MTFGYIKLENYKNSGLLRGPARGLGGPRFGASTTTKGTHNVKRMLILHCEMRYHIVVSRPRAVIIAT